MWGLSIASDASYRSISPTDTSLPKADGYVAVYIGLLHKFRRISLSTEAANQNYRMM